MEENKNEEKIEEVVNEQSQIENPIVGENKKCKSNKPFVIIIVVIAMALTFGCGIMLGKKLFENKKSNNKKETEVVDNNQNESKDNKPSLDDNNDIDQSDNNETQNVSYIDIKTKYVNENNKKYNIQLAKKEYDHVYQNGNSEKRVEYAIYDADNKKLITGYDYRNGPYYDANSKDSSYDAVEKIANASVIRVNNVDYIFIYVVASGFEDAIGYFVIYNPNDGNVIKGDTFAIANNDEDAYLYDDGQFAVLLNLGGPETSEGWYKDTVRSDKPTNDLIIFSENGKFIRKQASTIKVNSNKTFSLFTMDIEEKYVQADYSNTKVEIYNIKGELINTYKNVVSVMDDYILALDGNDLVMYEINGNKNIIEKNVSKDYIYRPYMYIDSSNENIINIARQKKSTYDAWSNGEIINYQITK